MIGLGRLNPKSVDFIPCSCILIAHLLASKSIFNVVGGVSIDFAPNWLAPHISREVSIVTF